MRIECSPAVERALEIAEQMAGSIPLAGKHLFLALTEDEDGRAGAWLIRLGHDWQEIRQKAQESSTTPLEKVNVLRHARQLTEGHGDRTVTGEYLLIAILQLDPTLCSHLELDIAILEQELAETNAVPIEVPEPIGIPEPADWMGAARILDVCANRARESLRILDDYVRFIVQDRILTHTIKSLRHEFVESIKNLPPRWLIAARDTLQDVGTQITTSTELERSSVGEVALVNLKRLQEALRSLEEFGKIIETDFSRTMEQLRYRTYTLEKALTLIQDSRQRLVNNPLCVLLTGSQCVASLEWTIHEAAAGGARLFQMREKSLDDRQLVERGRQFRKWTHETQSLFIVNDRPDIARIVEADGVHLGQEDMNVADARKILGPDRIIGVSTHHIEQVRQAVLEGANYIGVGPTFPSTTKSFDQFSGLSFVQQAMQETTLPAYAIGGINLKTVDAVVKAGARGIAVSAAIAQSEEPRIVAQTLIGSLRT